WMYAPGENAHMWDAFYSEGIMGLGWDKIGDLSQYKTREEIKAAITSAYGGEGSKMNDVLANEDFHQRIKVGDVIIVKKGRNELLGYGVVDSEYFYDSTRSSYQKCRKVNWKLTGNWKVDFNLVLKTLTDITQYATEDKNYNTYYERLLGIMQANGTMPSPTPIKYPLNSIFYGPPGTGKTYNTVRRAAELIEERIIEDYSEALHVFNKHLHTRIEFITFHQNYSYEDFIQGLRPDTNSGGQLSFEKKDGIFKIIADRALKNVIASRKPPAERSLEKQFDSALELFIDKLSESDGIFQITENCQVYEVEEDAFRYKGDNWIRHSNGIRMKFADLREFYLQHVKNRRQIKDLQNISALAKQHATYYFGVYEAICKYVAKSKPEAIPSQNIQNYVLIIDEINRANISRVFGELITLIEPDKRDGGKTAMKVSLPSGDSFTVPGNLYIIGTMNTADKSIALLDIALRRRFEFEPMYPKYDLPHATVHDADVLKKINARIIQTKGHDFQIGHAYFMGEDETLVQRMNGKVIPLLLEYYMHDTNEVKNILRSSDLLINEEAWPLQITGRNASAV
ncbi:MAG: AAA family ATPase, partial [Bacteroidia bacterium]